MLRPTNLLLIGLKSKDLVEIPNFVSALLIDNTYLTILRERNAKRIISKLLNFSGAWGAASLNAGRSQRGK
jgi:hypothetical protein